MYGIRNYEIEVKDVQLYIPPISWTGDPRGHIGVNDVFFYVLDGECYLNIDENCSILRSGELAFLPKGKKRTYTAISENFKMYEIGFSAKVNGQDLFENLNFTEGNYSVKTENRDLMAFYFENSIEFAHQPKEQLYIKRAKNLMCIISEYTFLRNENEHKEIPFKAVTDYMKKNLGGKVTLQQLAKLSFMQPNYFIRRFTEAFGTPPLKYYAKLKCYYAMSLLAHPNISVEQISKMCGIEDKAYFALFFKKHTSLTPTAYRKKLSVKEH